MEFLVHCFFVCIPHCQRSTDLDWVIEKIQNPFSFGFGLWLQILLWGLGDCGTRIGLSIQSINFKARNNLTEWGMGEWLKWYLIFSSFSYSYKFLVNDLPVIEYFQFRESGKLYWSMIFWIGLRIGFDHNTSWKAGFWLWIGFDQKGFDWLISFGFDFGLCRPLVGEVIR